MKCERCGADLAELTTEAGTTLVEVTPADHLHVTTDLLVTVDGKRAKWARRGTTMKMMLPHTATRCEQQRRFQARAEAYDEKGATV